MNRFKKHQFGWLLVTVGISGVVAWADSPVQWRGSPGWEPSSAYCRLYDAKHVITVKGTIQRVEKIVPLKGMGEGVYFMLKTDSETLPVHLGPEEYVEKQPIVLQAGDVVEVTVAGVGTLRNSVVDE